jgi:general secretion pathway protein J
MRPKRPLETRPAAGFTLTELLVALSMLALMSVFTYRAVSSALDAEAHVKKISSQWMNLAIFFDQLERDTMQAIARPIRGQSGAHEPALVLRGADSVGNDQAAIEWSKLGTATEGSGTQRVGYRLNGQKLQYLSWPVLDRAATSEPQSVTLQDDIRALSIRCLSRDGRWSERWPENAASNELPRAIEVTVTLANGSALVRLFPVGAL